MIYWILPVPGVYFMKQTPKSWHLFESHEFLKITEEKRGNISFGSDTFSFFPVKPDANNMAMQDVNIAKERGFNFFICGSWCHLNVCDSEKSSSSWEQEVKEDLKFNTSVLGVNSFLARQFFWT